MAATFDAIASTVGINAVLFDPPFQMTSSWNHTCVSTVNKYLLISIAWIYSAGNSVGFQPVYVDSLTYDGNACTFLDSNTSGGYTNELWGYAGTLYTSAKTLVVAWGDPSPTESVIFTASMSSISVIGANQAAPLVGVTKASGTGTTVSATRAGASAQNLFIDASILRNASTNVTYTKVANSTSRYKASVGTTGSRSNVGRSSVAATGASQTISWTSSVSKPWCTMIAEIAATPPPGGTLIQPNIPPMGFKMLGGLL